MITAIKCPTSRPTLQIGAKGQSVTDMQRLLNQRLAEIYTPALQIVVDGDFGTETQNAVKFLQCLAYLTVDGVVGSQTWGFLCDGTSCLTVLRINSCGNLVKLVQQTLADVGYYNGAIDGIFGVLTEKAVKDFQAYYSLAVDGVIGRNTWAALIGLDVHVSSCYCKYYGGC